MLTLYTYRMKVLYVIDGDSVKGIMDKGRKEYQEFTFRLSGINAPELNSSDPVEREAAKASKEFLQKLLEGQEYVYIQTTPDWDKYGGRLDAHIWRTLDNSQKHMSQLMIDAGHAKPAKY